MQVQYSTRQIIGSTIWWTEGTKSRKDKRWKNAFTYSVDVTNTDPKIIRAFLSFLRNDIGIDESRLKLQLQIHQGDNKKELEKFWSQATGVPFNRFHKTIIRPMGNKAGKTKGTCKVRYCDKAVYKKIMGLHEEILLSY